MKKISAKPIIMSALAALAFGTVTVGTTFALFTDKAETKINVKAGVVDVDNEISIKEVKELGGVAAVKDASADLYTNSIGSTTELLSNKAVKLTNWVPGDKAVFTINSVNKSNVNIKTRFTVKHTSSAADKDLYRALTISYKALDENNQDIGYKFMDWNLLPAVSETDLANGGKVISKVEVTVEFADDGDKTIRERTEGANNGYQGKDCEITFTQEAVQGNANVKSKIEEMNALLAAELTPNKTMHEALSDVSSVMDASQLLTVGYVWNAETDRFAYPQEVTESEYKYFKVYSEMPAVADQEFSVYAYGTGWTTAVNLSGIGFDAGTVSGIPSVSYTNDVNGREVVIRTNSAATTLIIDDSSTGSIYHYGTAGALNIIQCNTSSYHENGKVAYAEIAKGRIALEKGSDVEEIHINKKESEQAFDTVIITNNGGTAELPERITRDAVEVTNKTLVVTVESNGLSEDVYVYENGELGTTQKVVDTETPANNQNADVNSALGQLVLDNGSAGEKAQTADEKLNAKESATSEALSEEIKDSAPEGVEYVARIGLKGYERLDVALAANKVDTTVVLLSDYELPVDYTPVSMFEGTFDGANHKIYTEKAINAGQILESLTKTVVIKDLTISAYGHLATIAGDKYNYDSVTFDNVDYEALDDTYYQIGHNESLYTSYCYDYARGWRGTVKILNCDVKMNLKGATSSNSAVFFGGYYLAYDNCVLNVLDCSYSGTFIGNYVALVASNGQDYSPFNKNMTIEGLKNNGTLIGTNGAYAVGAQNHYGECSDPRWNTYYDEVQSTTGGTYTIMDNTKLSGLINEDKTVKIVDNGVNASSYQILLYASRLVYNTNGVMYASEYNFGIKFNIETSGNTNIKKLKMVDYDTAIEEGLITASDCSDSWIKINSTAEYQIVTINDISYYIVKLGVGDHGQTYKINEQEVTVLISAYDENGILKAVAELN